MSPTQSREINGHRPSPLKINKDSHLIHKLTSSSSSSSSTSSLSLVSTGAAAATANKQQQRHPVIIYTHSPKIIHTQARDFMALVQKLTGLAPSEERNGTTQKRQVPDGGNSLLPEMSTSDEKAAAQVSSSPISPIFDPPNPFFSEIPLFTPNSSDFFCSPKPFYRYQDSALGSQYGELNLTFHP